ncbi:hypothetical protein F2Q68_00025915 [Brassica cretica]|uniref:Uncharacterized protein n=1 Tax=Brassica cretica TaxID=69181 RepID=A0A8S9IJB1_BRACR|nr:hypothetical protein F2Q68_00025915 [Brassica cretica]
MLTREDMAVMLRLNLMSHQATLEGRELIGIKIRMAQQLKEPMSTGETNPRPRVLYHPIQPIISMMASSYFERPQKEKDTFEDHIDGQVLLTMADVKH